MRQAGMFDEQGRITRTYRKWTSMIQRCTNAKHPAYPYYGGRGIAVCERWRIFVFFFADMGSAPEGYWLDRIDNEKGYQPGNCRWVTPKESASNRRPKTVNPNSIRQKAIAAGLNPQVVWTRLRWGWTEEKALSTPAGKPGRMTERRKKEIDPYYSPMC